MQANSLARLCIAVSVASMLACLPWMASSIGLFFAVFVFLWAPLLFAVGLSSLPGRPGVRTWPWFVVGSVLLTPALLFSLEMLAGLPVIVIAGLLGYWAITRGLTLGGWSAASSRRLLSWTFVPVVVGIVLVALAAEAEIFVWRS